MRLPSVTRVLDKYTASYYQTLDQRILAYAQTRGTTVHNGCFAIARGVPLLPEPPAEYQPYMDSFKIWFDKFVEDVWLIEPEFIDDELGFLGHPDLIVSLKQNNILALVDIKTPVAFQPMWMSQLSAYHHLAKKNGYDCEVVGTLQLNEGGGLPKFTHLGEPRKHFYAGFYHALMAHKYFLNIGVVEVD